MKRILYLVFVIAMLLTVVGLNSCNPDTPPAQRNTEAEEKLKALKEVGFYEGENSLLLFDETEHQLYLKKSSSAILFRLLSDDASRYVEITLEKKDSYAPEDVINCTVKDTGFEKVTGRTLDLVVVKKEDNKLWLSEYELSKNPFGAIVYWPE